MWAPSLRRDIVHLFLEAQLALIEQNRSNWCNRLAFYVEQNREYARERRKSYKFYPTYRPPPIAPLPPRCVTQPHCIKCGRPIPRDGTCAKCDRTRRKAEWEKRKREQLRAK